MPPKALTRNYTRKETILDADQPTRVVVDSPAKVKTERNYFIGVVQDSHTVFLSTGIQVHAEPIGFPKGEVLDRDNIVLVIRSHLTGLYHYLPVTNVPINILLKTLEDSIVIDRIRKYCDQPYNRQATDLEIYVQGVMQTIEEWFDPARGNHLDHWGYLIGAIRTMFEIFFTVFDPENITYA